MSEEISKPLSFNDALKILDNASTEGFTTNVWIPSLKRNVLFKEINAKQQKKLLQCALDSSIAKSTFPKTFYQIVKENCLEENISSTFTIIDKINIALVLRNQISKELKIELQENPKVEKTIELQSVINLFKEYKHPEAQEINIDKNTINLKLTVEIPYLELDTAFEEYTKSQPKADDIDVIKQTITEAFLVETGKYIKDLIIDNQDFRFSAMTVAQRLALIEKLPAAVLQSVIQIAAQWKGEVNDILTVKSDDNSLSRIIDIDSMLFLSI
jgi:hypothetical protein